MSAPVRRFGLVTAAPHEHLIHLRKGRVVHASQGGSAFVWPGDSVALVDTSVHRLQFTADQITLERTGVQVTGLAVFRIVRPLLAWRMLNLQDFGAVEGILREMLMGATRRLVANLSLDDCLTRRKDALAAELLAEVAPVVQGRGREGDDTDRGWGIALDTIEVQDVRILSEEVFQRLQAPYREALALEALQAQAEVQRASAGLEDERQRSAETRRRALMALQEERLEAERQRSLEDEQHAAEVERRKLAARLARDEEQARSEARRREQDAELGLALAAREAEASLAREEQRAESEARQAELRARAERVERGTRAELVRLEREAESVTSEGRLQELLLTRTLPEVSRAWRDSYDKIVVTGASDLSFIGQGLTQVLASLEAFGVTPSFARREEA